MKDIIDLIDGAVGDATSHDAMRWTPEPSPEPVGMSLAEAQTMWAWMDDVIRDLVDHRCAPAIGAHQADCPRDDSCPPATPDT